jgi:hypothetical protein
VSHSVPHLSHICPTFVPLCPTPPPARNRHTKKQQRAWIPEPGRTHRSLHGYWQSMCGSALLCTLPSARPSLRAFVAFLTFWIWSKKNASAPRAQPKQANDSIYLASGVSRALPPPTILTCRFRLGNTHCPKSRKATFPFVEPCHGTFPWRVCGILRRHFFERGWDVI